MQKTKHVKYLEHWKDFGLNLGGEKELLEDFQQRNEIIYLVYVIKRITLIAELRIISKGPYQLLDNKLYQTLVA